MIYPEFEDVLYINREIVGGRGAGLCRDGQNRIKSAIVRMQGIYFDKDPFPSLFDKAAAVIHSLVTTHPFLDGNKRTGLITGLQFLYDNGLSCEHDVSDDELADVIIGLADSKISQEKLSAWSKKKFERYTELNR